MDMRQYSGSQFIGVDDIKGGPFNVTIAKVVIGKFDRPDLILTNGQRIGVNATNNKTLVRAYGPNSTDWHDHTVQLSLDMVEYQGKDTPTVRITPISKPDKAPTPLTKKSAIDEFDGDSEISF